MPKITLREHEDGELYAVEQDVLFDRPVAIETWWPLGLSAAAFKRNYGPDRIGQALVYANGSGVYMGVDDRLQYRLENGGATLSKYTEQVALLPPKTKLATRWRNGRWEKLSSKGWVAC